MTQDEEDLAVAFWLQRTQGKRAEVYVAEQIGALALQGDEAGIARWKAIAAQFQSIKESTAQ